MMASSRIRFRCFICATCGFVLGRRPGRDTGAQKRSDNVFACSGAVPFSSGSAVILPLGERRLSRLRSFDLAQSARGTAESMVAWVERRCGIREPFNGLSHLAGAVFSAVGLLVLLLVCWGKPWHVTGFLVYGVSMVVLYLASTLYHSLPGGPHRIR